MTKATDAQAAKTKEAVKIILTQFAGVREDEAAALADVICEEALRTCRMIRAVETRCGALCRGMLTDNPSRDMDDPAGLLRRELAELDGRREKHGAPDDVGTAEEMAFRASLDEARGALDEDRIPQTTDEEICDLIAEIMTRVALYDALDSNAMDASDRAAAEQELFVPPQELRDCAYSAAVLMKDEQVRSDPALAVLRACLVYRLGYIDQHGIEETDGQIAGWMRMCDAADAPQDAPVPEETADREKARMKKLFTAMLAGAAALLLTRPLGKPAGMAAAVLAYLLLS